MLQNEIKYIFFFILYRFYYNWLHTGDINSMIFFYPCTLKKKYKSETLSLKQ